MELVSKEKMLEKLAMLPADQFYNVASIRNFIKAEEPVDCFTREEVVEVMCQRIPRMTRARAEIILSHVRGRKNER